jgi:trk system potassium uptake protein TrkA
MYGIIVGSGRLGAALAASLSDEGHDVVVVDRDPESLERLGSGFNGRTVLGTGIDKDVLLRAGIDQADFVCAVTSDDLVNLTVAQLAKRVFGVERVVARIFDPQREGLYEDLGIQSISTTSLGVLEMKDILALDGFSRVVTFEAGSLVAVSFVATEALDGKTAGSIAIPRKLSVLTLTRKGAKFIASPDDPISKGDLVCALVRVDALDIVRDAVGLPSGPKRVNGGAFGL